MKRLMRLSTPLFSSTHFIIEGSVAELTGKTKGAILKYLSLKCRPTSLRRVGVPWAGGEGRGEGRDEARQETEGVFSREAKVDQW